MGERTESNRAGGDTGFLSGGGALAELIRSHDWSATPLGPVARWPQSLKTTVSLMLNSQQPMWLGWGPQATFLYNDAYISVLSLAKHPWALGRPASVVWAEIWDVCGPLADKVFGHGQASFQDDVRLFMRREGCTEEVFYSFSYSPVRDESGGVGGLFCPSTDTTGKVLGARRLGTLSQLAAQALVQGTVAQACATAMDIVAMNPDDLPFALLYLADADGRLRLQAWCNVQAPREAIEPPRLWDAEHVFATHVPTTVPVPPGIPGLPIGLAEQPVKCVRVLPVSRAADEQPFGVLVAAASPARPLDREYLSFFDLVASQLASTVQNARAVEETRDRAETLAQLDRAKTVFFSNVSHELRTPLTLMLGPLQDLADEGSLKGEAGQALSLALRNGRRLHRLVNTLLDFSRIEAGRVSATFVPVDLAALTAELASSFRSAVEKAGMWLDIDCHPTATPTYVDAEMWEKIVLNLVSNAFKYTLRGGIHVGLREESGQAVLAVQDTGHGIPEKELPRLFERFHRVEGTQGRTHEGTGIGLALVHELVKLHGGAIQVRSRLGEGTTFEVRLPTGKAHLPPGKVRDEPHRGISAGGGAFVEEALGWIPGEESAATLPGTSAERSGARVLLADDNGDMREYIARLLRAEGHEVRAVPDGEVALAELRREPADLVLTDVMMPRLDGFGLLKGVREDAALSTTPVIMLSARAGEEARVEGLQAGADDYLVKPFSARELVARVGSTLAASRIRREALANERHLRQEITGILESIGEGFLAMDRDWRFTYVNAEAERINGIRREDVLGRNHWDVYAAARGTLVEEKYNRVMERREPEHFQYFYEPWQRWIEINAYPLADGGIALYFRDITERKRIEKIAQEAERRKDEFIATLAHELRNPLAPIRTGLQVMQRAPGSDAAARMREVMERQVNHMVRLIDDLMDVARISRGKLELRKERVTLADIVKTAVETCKPLLDTAKHELFTSLPHETVWLDADPTRLAQAVANLLNNAAKYTPEGGRITLTARRTDGHATIQVADTGAGITPQLIPFLFEMFMQGENSRGRAQGGLGIGLTMVKQLVQLHGGDVSAASPGTGQGSTFTITLPVAAQRGDTTAHDTLDGQPAAGRKLQVLVADDNKDAADTLSMLLQLMGHSCIAVHDGPAAIEAFQRVQPDVVMLDIGMPNMDGYEVARRLRQLKQTRRPRLLALTGWGAAADRARSREAGFDQHLTKPVDFATLQSALES
ncbi:ATP-binding protein [Ramlibacter humi]|uniref:histidine kinase n=1 Tax=Ramlibacter humi TaxID=2530451 RepID=A0A4Z0C7U2_9BURK|nr:ATP-binding protein [Ramlibacter humi]TFZ07673.1 response regulator [Ramlibacter humi]